MATVKPKFRPSTRHNLMGKVYYQVIHRREVIRITSSIALFPAEWNSENEEIGFGAGERTQAVEAARLILENDIKLLEKIIISLEKRRKEYAVHDVAKMFEERKTIPSFLDFMRIEISRRKGLGKEGTAHNFKSAYNSFDAFLGERKLTIKEVTRESVEAYQAWLQAKGAAKNTISFYMRILRCVYNLAVKNGLTHDRKPFATVYTGIDKTRKRAISASEIKRIKDLDLKVDSRLEQARDIFLLSFYCMGISFVDLATLKKTNIADGRLTYKRAKTGQTISMAINPKMSAMFEKYSSEKNSPFLMNIIKDPHGDVRKQYQNELNLVNRYLKKIGRMVGLNTSLTTYVTRHSWASIARSKNIRISVISDALGHDSEMTTQIYLASLDTGHIDRANEIILKGL